MYDSNTSSLELTIRRRNEEEEEEEEDTTEGKEEDTGNFCLFAAVV